jgi:hypothetical protein
MERSSSTGINQILVVVPHKQTKQTFSYVICIFIAHNLPRHNSPQHNSPRIIHHEEIIIPLGEFLIGLD